MVASVSDLLHSLTKRAAENLRKYLFSACLVGTMKPATTRARFVGGYA
jgi:hypothetical protein